MQGHAVSWVWPSVQAREPEGTSLLGPLAALTCGGAWPAGGPLSPDALPASSRQAVAQTMDSVFKELLGKTASRQGLGPAPTNSPGPGPRSPKPAACSRLGKNKGFSRGPGTPASPSTAHPQGLDSLLKPH